MDAWRNKKQFIALLAHKQDVLKSNIVRIERRAFQIRAEIKECQDEQQYLNLQIKLLTPSGLLARADIYKGIRHQGALLIHLQMVVHKIKQLEDEEYENQQLLETYSLEKQSLDKRYYKVALYIEKQQCDYYRRRDNNSENEIQEGAIYDRK